MKSALVSGGAGFIGLHLCESLLEKGFEVVCIDNLLTGSEQNISHLKPNQNFGFVKADTTKALPSSVTEKKFTHVFNLASPASPLHYQIHPIETLEANSLGTKAMLEIAVKNKASFLQASTSEVYGSPAVHPQVESYWGNVNPIGLRSCYDEGKRFSEALVMAYRRVANANTKIIRIFNTYGPRMQVGDGRVIPNFITSALANKPIPIFGSGKQTRSLCYVSDLVEGLLLAIDSKEHEPINLGNPNELTMLELAQKIIFISGSKSRLEFRELPQDDPERRKPDISKAKTILGWKPEVSVDVGLKRTIEWFRKN